MANALTISRLLWAGLFAMAAAWAAPAPPEWIIGAMLALVILSESSDLVDGYVARRTGTVGELGGLLDPWCDSLARLTMFFALALSGGVSIAVPFVMTARDITVAYTRIIQAHTGGKTSARSSGKFKAIVQGAGLLVLVAIVGRHAGWAEATRWIAAAAIIVVTIWSLADYVRSCLPGIAQLRRRNDHPPP